ncbi:MAG: FHA domain-containing protein [Deltaproteobacteria bacterium]|nr:FHA domain-containing protein [Deltaproteobacteria bacterium]
MILIFPAAAKLLEEKNCSIQKFDAVFYDIISATKDGYFTISEKDDMVHLFVVGGRPYASGRIEKGELSFLDIHEFFDTYSQIGTADLTFYKVEKKLLLSILVYFKKRPIQKFTADMIDMEKVLLDLAAKGADSIIATKCGDKMGFSICLKGRPSFNYLPDGKYAQEQPKDGLLLYIFGEKTCVPSIEVFDDIHMTSASDAIPQKDELPKSLIAYYFKKPGASASVKGAEIILMLADKIVNKYAITKTETTIGRGAGSDILLENPGVSRHHAVIVEKSGKFFIEDKGSSNGTFMNGEKIASRELKDGDQIQILKHILVFKAPLSAAKEAASAEKTMYVDPSQIKASKPGVSTLVLEDGKEFSLKFTVTTIGSGEETEIKLEGGGVAEHHASILRGKGGEFVLVHKGGKTTKVNGAKIQEHHLKSGDVIEIGEFKITYQAS